MISNIFVNECGSVSRLICGISEARYAKDPSSGLSLVFQPCNDYSVVAAAFATLEPHFCLTVERLRECLHLGLEGFVRLM
jgi:hypothetical protein